MRPELDLIRGKISRLTSESATWAEFASRATAVVARAIGVDAWCIAGADPETLLMTEIVTDDGTPPDPRFFALEYGTPDYLAQIDLVRANTHAGTLAKATDGALSKSPRWRELLEPSGLDDQLRVAFTSREGCWGFASFMRTPSGRRFDAEQVRLVAQLGSSFADGLRVTRLRDEAGAADRPNAPGLVVVDRDLRCAGATQAAIELLGHALEPGEPPPPLVLSVTAQLRALRASGAWDGAVPVAHAMVAGAWVIVTASPIGREEAEETAVIVQRAAPRDVVHVALRGFGLTAREGDVARLVSAGHATDEIAGTLHISPLTVQQHLKSIFDKTGVRSRRELVALLFVRQYRTQESS